MCWTPPNFKESLKCACFSKPLYVSRAESMTKQNAQKKLQATWKFSVVQKVMDHKGTSQREPSLWTFLNFKIDGFPCWLRLAAFLIRSQCSIIEPQWTPKTTFNSETERLWPLIGHSNWTLQLKLISQIEVFETPIRLTFVCQKLSKCTHFVVPTTSGTS